MGIIEIPRKKTRQASFDIFYEGKKFGAQKKENIAHNCMQPMKAKLQQNSKKSRRQMARRL